MKITARQLRQIIKEELKRVVLKETNYPFNPVTSVSLPNGGGTLGFTTSTLEDNGYTWEFAISPAWAEIKAGVEREANTGGTMAPARQYTLDDIMDNFQVSLLNARPGLRLPGGLTPADLPAYVQDLESGYFNIDAVFKKLESVARSQGKSNLADNIAFVIKYKNYFDTYGDEDV